MKQVLHQDVTTITSSAVRNECTGNEDMIALNRATIVRILTSISFLLVIANIAAQCTRYLTPHQNVYGLIHLFDLDEENNLPSWFSASLLLGSAVLLAIIAHFERKSRARCSSKWAILAWTFLYLAVDEAASIHELLIRPTDELLGPKLTTGIFSATWVVPALAVAAPFAFSFFRFLLHLPAKVRSLFLLAGTLYIGGAVGLEMISNWYFEQHLFNLTYSIFVTLEESLEMAGAIVLIHALLLYIEANYLEVRFRFGT